jgi:predicted lipoprotein with Yx(FWY)xxD motif
MSITVIACAIGVVGALAAAGCGSNGTGASGSSAPTTASGQPATIGVANNGLGAILVDSRGRTLYLFERDRGTRSACTGVCATQWPPLRAHGKPTVGSGVKASMVATSARSDGKAQITYNGHPLYTFSGDQRPGDRKGQGVNAFGGLWYALSAAGDPITTQMPISGFGY